MLSKLAKQIKSRQYELFLGSCIVLISVVSYNLGQINSLRKTPITIQETREQKLENDSLKADIFDASSKSQAPISKQIINSKSQIQKTDTRVVVSKNSNKYHYTYCSGAKRIKTENQIWFNSAIEAEKAGYTLAGNCQQ